MKLTEIKSDDTLRDGFLVILANWTDSSSNKLNILKFIDQQDRRYIPLFSSWRHFEKMFGETKYAVDGLEISISILEEIISDNDLLILDKGSSQETLIELRGK